MSRASPTFGDIEDFLAADGWRQVRVGGRRQRHLRYEKLLADGRLLQTQISHSRAKSISPGRFAAILREQLEVSREQFWQAIRAGEPVERPVDLDEPEPAVEHPAWVVRVLVEELHLSTDEISSLSTQEAIDRVHEHWSGRKDR
jgi:hypothetical protein